MKDKLACFVFLAIGFLSLSQDTTFLKISYAGNILKVPEDKIWTIKRAFISEGGQYAIQIRANNFSTIYNPNETIELPLYIPEMELLNLKDMVQFHLYISESTNK
jgi:hypothetical protein